MLTAYPRPDTSQKAPEGAHTAGPHHARQVRRALSISCRSRASPQMHHGHRTDSALLFPRCVCTMCVVSRFLELRPRCRLMLAVCVYTATKWTYGHTFGTWRFLGLSGFATLGAFTDNAVICAESPLCSLVYPLHCIHPYARPARLSAGLCTTSHGHGEPSEENVPTLPHRSPLTRPRSIYSTAEEELAHSSLVLRIPHNHYGALGDITPFRHLNPRVFTVSPLPNYHSEDETVAAHVALQLHMHPHDVPAALHTPMPGGTMLNPAGAGTPQPASAVAPVLAVPAVAAAPGAPVAPALPGAAPALTPPSTEELAAAHVRRPRNWREWRREHAANAPAAPPAATPAENTADSSAKQ